MLTCLFSLFYITGECHRFLHRGSAWNRGVRALRGIMSNQGKIAEKQSGKICVRVFLHISVLTFVFVKLVLL